jgi:16S rRNA (guanine527-N7)-methyltransferase
MFHVKHRSETPGADNRGVAAEVRRRVEERLSASAWVPASSAFFPRIETFARLLSIWGARHNLTAEPQNPSELTFHILDSVMALAVLANEMDGAELFDSGQDVLDLGSGAGLPALVLAAATDAKFRLVESRRKRVSFLRVAAAEMRLQNVRIESRFLRPEDIAPHFDVVTARAFAKPAEVLPVAFAGLRRGGRIVLYAAGEAAGSKTELLAPEQRLSYRVARGNKMVSRSLLIWRKP